MRPYRPLLCALLLVAAQPGFPPAPASAGPIANPIVQLPWTPHGATSLARYGSVVAPAGDVNGDGFSDVLVGAPKEEGPNLDAGRVYLFLGSKNGLVTMPSWSWSANQAQGGTGTAAAAAGDVNGDGFGDVVVGTPGWTVTANANAGKISIFHGAPSAAGLPANPSYERTAPTPTAQARFGAALGTAGNVNGDPYADVIVGAPGHTSGGLTGRGAAFAYHGGPSGLGAAPAQTYLGAQAGANLGKAVSTAGDVDADGFSDVLIGAPRAIFEGAAKGTASLYRGSGAGLLAVADTVLGGENEDEERGAAVANAGDIDGDGYADVLTGSPGWGFGDLHRGRYDLIRGGPGGLQFPAVFRFDGQNVGERLGAAVATLGDIDADGYAEFAVGMPTDSSTSGFFGKVRIHFGGPPETSNYMLYHELFSSAPQAQIFGFAIATAGDVDGDGFSEFLVGDPNDSFAEGEMEGTAWLFERARSEPAVMSGGPIQGQPDTRRGAAVAIIPGMDGGGFPMVALGEPGYDLGQETEFGNLLLMRGSRDGLDISIAQSRLGETAGEQFSARLADVGDVNRDGWTDLLISSPTRAGAAGSQVGRVWLWKGKTNFPLDDPLDILEGDQALARVGSAIAGRGDINGDGYHDLIIGARDWDGPSGLTDCGKVWVFFGAASGLGPGQWTTTGTAPNQGLGASVALGDLDGDAYADVIIGSVSPLAVSPPAGKVAVHHGGPGGPSTSPTFELNPLVPSSSFGTALAVGDINGDGVADLLVGAPTEVTTGRVYLFPGGLGRGRPSQTWARTGTQVGAQFGAVIASGGDVDGDGRCDLVVASPKYDAGPTDAGRVQLFYGHPFEPQLAWTFDGNTPSMELGAAVAPLNDLNLDGFADIAVGAPLAVPGGMGYLYVFAGNGRVGVGRMPSLLKDFSSAPFLWRPARIASDLTPFSSFALRSAEGRGRVSGEFEVVTQNQTFTGEATIVSPLFDTGTPTPGFGSSMVLVQPLTLPWMGTAYKIRTRSRSQSPFFPGSRWIRPETSEDGNFDLLRGGTEVDVDPWPGTVTGVARLVGIAPNPVTSSGLDGGAALARISFALPRETHVAIDLYDVRGARVRQLVDGLRPSGVSSAAWDGRDDAGRAVPAGIYFVRFMTEGVADQGRFVRLP